MTSVLDANVLVVNQKAKLVELTNEYTILDESGTTLGTIRQEGQSKVRKALRLLSSVDQFLNVSLTVRDAEGQEVLRLQRPPKFLKSRVEVSDPGGPVGTIIQENVVGKIRFGLIGADGAPLGAIRAENWRAWNFSIVDTADREVARITKSWAGFGREMFTTADHYVLEVSDPSLGGPLRKMIVAAAAAVDTALKQDE